MITIEILESLISFRKRKKKKDEEKKDMKKKNCDHAWEKSLYQKYQ